MATRQQLLQVDGPPATETRDVVAKPVVSNVQDKETVRGQLRELLDTGNPLLRQSRDRAVTQAASRGLQNSTMAAQAGEAAFIDAALPIASADATTHSNRAILNVDTQNRFGLQEQGGNITSKLQKEQGDISSRLQGEQGTINSKLQREQGDISSRLQSEQGTIASHLQSEQGNINSRLQREQAGYREKELNIQFHHERLMADRTFQNQQALLATEFAQRLGLTREESRLQVERMNVQHAQTLAQIDANGRAQSSIDGAQFSRQLGGSYLTAVNNRQTAASSEIQTIYTTQGLTSQQQAAAVNNAYARLNNDLTALAAYYRQAPAWDRSWSIGATGGVGQPPVVAPPASGFPAPGARPPRIPMDAGGRR